MKYGLVQNNKWNCNFPILKYPNIIKYNVTNNSNNNRRKRLILQMRYYQIISCKFKTDEEIIISTIIVSGNFNCS